MAQFTEEIEYIKLGEYAEDFIANRPLEELLNNTIYNKETWEAWLNDPILNNRLQLNALMNVTGNATVNDTLSGANATIEGKSTTDSLEVNELTVQGEHPLQNSFPVGSLYINASNGADPSVILGFGEWEKFAQGRVLVGVGSGQFSGVRNTGGEKEVGLNERQLPSHTHYADKVGEAVDQHRHQYFLSDGDWTYSGIGIFGERIIHRHAFGPATSSPAQSSHSHEAETDPSGGGEPHNNMQPYITVYIWRRVN